MQIRGLKRELISRTSIVSSYLPVTLAKDRSVMQHLTQFIQHPTLRS